MYQQQSGCDYVWSQGGMCHVNACRAPLAQEEFLYGRGLFETILCYRKHAILLERHCERLQRSCAVIDLKPPSTDDMVRAVQSVIERNGLDEAAIRLTAYKQEDTTQLLVNARPLAAAIVMYPKPFSVVVEGEIRQNEFSPLSSVKSLNHSLYRLCAQHARERGADEAFILNTHGAICEGSRTNIFVVQGACIATPNVTSGCLPGIMRQFVIELIRGLGMCLEERSLSVDELRRSDELFVTNSLIGIVGVSSLDERAMSAPQDTAVTPVLQKRHFERLQNYCR